MQNVVAHFTDGRIIKGMSMDALPGNPKCHIRTEERGVVEVQYRDLKALYFVKNLDGNPEYRDGTEADQSDSRLRGSTQIRIRFRDGEEMVGLANAYPPKKAFFFTMPIDPKSNNLRVLVNRDAVSTMNTTKA